MPTIAIQWWSSDQRVMPAVDAITDDRATIAPTDRSMPPPVMTNVIPMLTTPMTEAARRIVSMLSTLAKRSPAVITPARHKRPSATTRPTCRHTPGVSRRAPPSSVGSAAG